MFVRDARWLIPVAQSPATDDLAPYFEVADEISAAFEEDDRLEIQMAVVRMAGGHLRSYLHYYITQKGVPLDDSRLVQITRKANALDYSLLIRGLVPLLQAYEHAVQIGDAQKRLELADAICQGVSPDPELFINRIELLGAYSMVEHLFTTTHTTTEGHGRAVYTPMGERHVRLLEEYAAPIRRVTEALYEDVQQLSPADGGYSPFGAIYGFSSNLLEHMALKSVERDAVTRFSLEDVFRTGGADKLEWVNGWRQLPHVDPQVAKLYAYRQAFAEQIFARVELALSKPGARTGRLFVVAENDRRADSKAGGDSGPPRPLHPIVGRGNRGGGQSRGLRSGAAIEGTRRGVLRRQLRDDGRMGRDHEGPSHRSVGRRPRCEDRWTARSTDRETPVDVPRSRLGVTRPARSLAPRLESIESIEPRYIIAAHRSRFAHVTQSRVVAKL